MKEFFGSKGKEFQLIVDSSGYNGSGSIVHCTIISGRTPQAGDRFCIERSGESGTISVSTSLEEAISYYNAISIGGTGHRNTSISFLTPDLPPHKFSNGDKILNL